MLDFLIAFSPALLLIVGVPSLMFLVTGLDEELNQFADIMRSLPRSECLRASERLSVEAPSKRPSSPAISSSGRRSFRAGGVIVLLSSLLTSALTVSELILSRASMAELDSLSETVVAYTLLRSCIFEASRHAESAVIFTHMPVGGTPFDGSNPEIENRTWGVTLPVESTSGNTELLFEQAARVTAEVGELLRLMAVGYADQAPIVGLSGAGDVLRFTDRCEVDVQSRNVASVFRCLSFERVLLFWVDMNLELVAGGTEAQALLMRALIDSRIALSFADFLNGISVAFRDTVETFRTVLIVILVAGIVIAVACFAGAVLVLSEVGEAMAVIRSLVLRVNPISFVAHPPLVVALGRLPEERLKSGADAVFQTSQDALLSLNGEGIIESLNPSATAIFGLSPEQMLGQPLKLLVNPELEGNAALFTTMHLMRSGQAGLVYEANVTGLKDDGKHVPLKLTLVGFASNRRSADSFAAVCKDQTDEVARKSAVEEAKQQSENLLMQILPKDIIVRLNRGDKNISFSVPCSTIVFMDIEKFSSYSANLTPSELMKNLGEVFTAYDRLVPKFPLILKIKLIGDDYMAAAGLFNPGEAPSVHASQVVQFTLECLDAIEEINEQLNASLQVRIGVNTGGPLIAGVLGTDKPLFDIIGDPINVAARLQSTDMPGLVQISQETYNGVIGGPFQIEQRGLVELKGKGKQMTYFVYPRERKGLNFDGNGED
jgi:PAS domain S-box-containing protein